MEHLKIGHFVIGNHMPGAQRFELTLTAMGHGQVRGQGAVTQAVNPPLDVKTMLSGSMASIVWGPDVHTIISLVGVPLPDGMPQPENVRCTMVLDNDQCLKAYAELQYRNGAGAWVPLTNLPVSGGWLNTH